MLMFATVHIATLAGYQSPVLSKQVNSHCSHLLHWQELGYTHLIKVLYLTGLYIISIVLRKQLEIQKLVLRCF